MKYNGEMKYNQIDSTSHFNLNYTKSDLKTWVESRIIYRNVEVA